MTLADWSNIAQIAIAIVTLAGVLVALYSSTRTLQELHVDRLQKHRPFLAFEPGGAQYPVKFVKRGKRIPGIDPDYVAKVFPNLPEDAESVDLDRLDEDGHIKPILVGKLKNYGAGPALEAKVTWVPEAIWVHGEKFEIDENKKKEPVYGVGLNTLPARPRHVMPNQTAGLTRLPTFIEKDLAKKSEKVDGHLVIVCKDVTGRVHISKQDFYIFTGYSEKPPWIHVTMRDMKIEGDAAGAS